MRMPVVLCSAVVLLLTACDAGSEAATTAAPVLAATPSAACSDAPELRQRATDERRQVAAARGDQARIVAGSRVNFHASLAVIAELRCSVTFAEADQALEVAFQAARDAEASASFYQQASDWGEANLAATRAIDMLVRRLPRAVEGER